MTSLPKKIYMLNASALKKSSCLRRLSLILNGYTSDSTPTVEIVYGKAFHKFREVFAKTNDTTIALAAAQNTFLRTPFIVKDRKDWMTFEHLLQTCMSWITNEKDSSIEYLRDTENVPLVEQTFAIPYRVTDTAEVILCGTIDALGMQKGGCYLLEDIKTTAFSNPDAYFRQYVLSPQLRFYANAIHLLAEKFPESIFDNMIKGTFGARIDGVFLSPSKDTIFKKSEVFFFKKESIFEFRLLLDDLVNRLLLHQDTNDYPAEGILNGSCAEKFSLCQYYTACSAENEYKRVLENHFKIVDYNPMKFSD